jgi:anaerobic selenocysteine-containing dehydrogenase
VHGLGQGEAMILPVTARDEEWSPTTQESMFNYVRLSDGGIERLDNVRPETVILCDLAAALMPGSPVPFAQFKEHREVRKVIASVVPGMEQLADIDVAKREFHIANRVMHEPKFGTTDNRAHFVVTPIPAQDRQKLTLATVRSEGQFNTIIYEEHDTYRHKAPRDAVFLNRDDMDAHGLSERGPVTLSSDAGNYTGTAIAFDLPRGSVLAYYPEANVLCGRAVDPRSKTPAFKSVPVWIAQ